MKVGILYRVKEPLHIYSKHKKKNHKKKMNWLNLVSLRKTQILKRYNLPLMTMKKNVLKLKNLQNA